MRWKKGFLQLLQLKVCMLLLIRQSKKNLYIRWSVYILSTFLEKRGTNKYWLRKVFHSILKKRQVKMLDVFSPIFVANTTIIFGYNFVVPLSNRK